MTAIKAKILPVNIVIRSNQMNIVTALNIIMLLYAALVAFGAISFYLKNRDFGTERKAGIELNGVANALALLSRPDPKVKEAMLQLYLFCEFVRATEDHPMAWHEYKAMVAAEEAKRSANEQKDEHNCLDCDGGVLGVRANRN